MSKGRAIGAAIMGAIMVLDFAVVPIGAAEPSYSVLPARVVEAAAVKDMEIRADEYVVTDIYVGRIKRRPKKAVKPYTDEELELLACTIYCEAGSDSISDETRRMVGEVVLNRVADERYPDTIEAVLTQKSQYGRFFWTGVVWPARAAREPEAVERAYDCARMVFTEERLLPTDVIFQSEHIQGEIVACVPGFWFCR